MNPTLEDLKARLAVAHKILAEATQQLQVAQQNQQKAASDFNVWNAAVAILTREEQAKQAAAHENQLPIGLSAPTPEPVQSSPTNSTQLQTSEAGSPNKTEIVRELLRQHPSGMTPSEIWKELGDQIGNRPYLYSVLKRLRDRDEVTLRRNKYAVKIKPEDARPHIDHVVQ